MLLSLNKVLTTESLETTEAYRTCISAADKGEGQVVILLYVKSITETLRRILRDTFLLSSEIGVNLIRSIIEEMFPISRQCGDIYLFPPKEMFHPEAVAYILPRIVTTCPAFTSTSNHQSRE